jgi:hypothetical protein
MDSNTHSNQPPGPPPPGHLDDLAGLTAALDLDSLLGHPGAVGGETGWVGPLDPEACRRLACDGAVTRVLVTRQPTIHPSATDQPTGKHHTPPMTPAARHHQTTTPAVRTNHHPTTRTSRPG